jgi:hypothetical protein
MSSDTSSLDATSVEITPNYPQDRGLVDFLGNTIFHDYEPCQFEPFHNRLEQWIANVDEPVDQATLLDIAREIFFVGKKEFEALYRSVFSGAISNWVIDADKISIFNTNISSQIIDGVNASWICPITDSLRINSFLKVNNLVSRELRPDWKSLSKFADIAKLQAYVASEKITKLILLEDFVGSGTQSKNTVKFAAASFPNLKILFCPLVVCPTGHKALKCLSEKYDNLSYRPTLVLPQETMVANVPSKGEPALHQRIRDLAAKFHSRVGGFGPFGFKNSGAMVVLYSNCPNNTLSIIHEQNENWSALFPRIDRVR